jgi:hypothetical protein
MPRAAGAAAGSGTAPGNSPSGARCTGKALPHFGHFTLIPVAGTRRSSMLYAALQSGQATFIAGSFRPLPTGEVANEKA